MRHLTTSIAGMAMAALAALGGCSNSDENTSGYGDNGRGTSPRQMRESATVEMTSTHQFNPRDITIRAGDTVTWKNASKDIHTVTADPVRVSRKEHVSLPQGAKP